MAEIFKNLKTKADKCEFYLLGFCQGHTHCLFIANQYIWMDRSTDGWHTATMNKECRFQLPSPFIHAPHHPKRRNEHKIKNHTVNVCSTNILHQSKDPHCIPHCNKGSTFKLDIQ